MQVETVQQCPLATQQVVSLPLFIEVNMKETKCMKQNVFSVMLFRYFYKLSISVKQDKKKSSKTFLWFSYLPSLKVLHVRLVNKANVSVIETTNA